MLERFHQTARLSTSVFFPRPGNGTLRAMTGTPPCPACGAAGLTLRKPVFEGLRKTGERTVCAACGHDVEPGPAPDAPARPALFADTEPERAPDPFAGDARGRLCRYCLHYVVNPFRQWCGAHRRDVDAMDACGQFEPRPGGEGRA